MDSLYEILTLAPISSHWEEEKAINTWSEVSSQSSCPLYFNLQDLGSPSFWWGQKSTFWLTLFWGNFDWSQDSHFLIPVACRQFSCGLVIIDLKKKSFILFKKEYVCYNSSICFVKSIILCVNMMSVGLYQSARFYLLVCEVTIKIWNFELRYLLFLDTLQNTKNRVIDGIR